VVAKHLEERANLPLTRLAVVDLSTKEESQQQVHLPALMQVVAEAAGTGVPEELLSLKILEVEAAAAATLADASQRQMRIQLLALLVLLRDKHRPSTWLMQRTSKG